MIVNETSAEVRRRFKTAPEKVFAAFAEARLLSREVRSYEASHVNGLWHWDAHSGSRKVLTAHGLTQPTGGDH